MLNDIYNVIATLYVDLFKYNDRSKPYIFNIYYGQDIIIHIDFALILSYLVIFLMVVYISFLFFKIVRWFLKMIVNFIRSLLHKVFGVPISLEIPPYIFVDRTNGMHYFYLLGFKFELESLLALIFTINLFIIAFCVYKKAHKKLK